MFLLNILNAKIIYVRHFTILCHPKPKQNSESKTKAYYIISYIISHTYCQKLFIYQLCLLLTLVLFEML